MGPRTLIIAIREEGVTRTDMPREEEVQEEVLLEAVLLQEAGREEAQELTGHRETVLEEALAVIIHRETDKGELPDERDAIPRSERKKADLNFCFV